MTSPTIRRRILIIDDEDNYVEVLRAYLETEGFSVAYAATGEQALQVTREEAFELLLLDLNLTDMSGIEVFRELRRYSEVPVIMVTSRGEEIDRVVGLELGADDYVAKPFSPRELVARVKSVLRRAAPSQPPAKQNTEDTETQRFGDLEIDRRGFEVRRGGKPLQLTPTEFRILDTLSRHPGQVFTRAQLLDLVAQEHSEVYDRTLDRHIANLRKKLENTPGNPEFIRTVVGVGYKFLS